MKKIIVIALIVVIVFSLAVMTACDTSEQDDEPNNYQAYVSLGINPSVELVVDGDNKVVSVRGENQDGLVLLYREVGITGNNLDDAIRKIIELSVEYGYLNENNRVVDTLVFSANSEFADKVLNTVNSTVKATAEKSGISVSIDGNGSYSLVRKAEYLKEQYPDDLAIQNMSVARLKLALSVSETTDVTLESAIEMSDEQLIETYKNSSSKIEEFATEAYNKAKEIAFKTYDKAVALSKYGVSARFYLEKSFTKPMIAYYGSVYQIYAVQAIGLNFVCDLSEYLSDLADYPLNDNQIRLVVESLGLESSDVLKNEKGEVTIKSIEEYADRHFKNTSSSELSEQRKKALSEALTEIENTIKQEINKISEEFAPQIESTVALAKQLVETLKSLILLLPTDVQTIINNTAKDVSDVVNEIADVVKNGELSESVVREKAKLLQAKADEYYACMQEYLTEQDKVELENRIIQAQDKMTEQKQELENALKKAEQDARDYLESLKESRKEQNK